MSGSSVSPVVGLVAASIPDGSRVATLGGEFTSALSPSPLKPHTAQPSPSYGAAGSKPLQAISSSSQLRV